MIKLPGGAYSKINFGFDPNSSTLGKTVNLAQLKAQLKNDSATTPVAGIYIIQGDDDTVLEVGEKFLVVITLPNDLALSQYQQFTVEIKPLQGAPLIVERSVPPTLTANEFVILG